MLFFEYSFLFVFLPVVLLGYYALPGRLRNAWLFVASCAFYACSSFTFLPILLVSTLIDFQLGKRLTLAKTPRGRRLFLISSVVLNLGILGFFKYAGLFTSSISQIPGLESIPILSVTLPIGISFYTFQSMSYTIDLYRNQATRTRSFIDFACYVTLYPQLIAGPIVRYQEVQDQLESRTHTATKFAQGIELFVRGLAKKILLADTAALLCSPLFDLDIPGFAPAWISVLLYSCQIYFDFSGYSDMAIGLGKMIGFEFPQNFNSPYKATSFANFWQRWHMTLSRWLRDNLYIPLGGNRRGAGRMYINLALTMLLGGLWHGAAWNYVVWGAYHGSLLAIERFVAPPTGTVAPRTVPFRRAFVFLAVSLGWVFFRCDDIAHSGRWLRSMFLLDGLGRVDALAVLGLLPLLGIVFFRKNTSEIGGRYDLITTVFLLALFVASVFVAYGSTSSPFLYFRF